MEQDIVRASVERSWTDEVLPSLAGLVTIPALSPAFDAQWPEHGQLRAAVDHVQAWIGTRGLSGATSEVIELPGRSPLLLVDVPATAGAAGADPGDGAGEDRGTVLLYGHLDKQPPVGGWADGLGPWPPGFRGGKLFGRGAADDVYAAYAATTALEAVRAAGLQRSRLLLQVHDELLFEAPEDEADALAAVAKEVMQDAVHISVPLVVETGKGRSWAEAH